MNSKHASQDHKTVSMRASRPFIQGYGVPESEEGMLPWSHVENLLDKSLNFWVGTVDEQGCPHATPVWGVWVEGNLYFDGSPKTRRGRNLASNPAVVIHLEDGTRPVILHGEAVELKTPPLDLRQKLAKAYTAKYRVLNYEAKPEAWEQGGLWIVHLKQAFAWTKFPDDATRWTFEG